MSETRYKQFKHINRIAAHEAIEYNIFQEYNALKKYLKIYEQDGKDENDKSYCYSLGRFKTLSYMVKCIKADPQNADWYDEDNIADLKEAGRLLYKESGMKGMRDNLVWSFIPKRYHREIDIAWDGIGEWHS